MFNMQSKIKKKNNNSNAMNENQMKIDSITESDLKIHLGRLTTRRKSWEPLVFKILPCAHITAKCSSPHRCR